MMITLENVTLVYGGNPGHQALSDINLKIRQGESWALIGPSGCGKSSLLFLMSGLLLPTTGSVKVFNEPVTRPRKDVALILQDYGLFPWKTVWENVALGLRLRHYRKPEIKKIVDRLLKSLGLAAFQHKYPNQLSGGQRQRVAVARALAVEPSILLMDEPFSALDALTREKLQHMVLDIWKTRNITLVFVTHNIEEAVFLGQKIAIMSPQPGKILRIINNEQMGSLDYRLSSQFHRQCTKVRQLLEGK